MTTKEECLAIFSVAAWANSDEAVADARRLVTEYLSHYAFEPVPQLAALRALYEQFLDLQLDSRAAVEIRKELSVRMGALQASL